MNKAAFSHDYLHCHRAYREEGVWSIDVEELDTKATLASFPVTLKLAEEDWQATVHPVV